ncbi:MAG TPA: hypothetical protein ENJ44_04540 [Oceanospirillales bacterium]|nr:hypothetical protein [Oceanospirillales bacterium]
MPFIVTQKNLEKVFAEHLNTGEQALVVTMCGARGVLGITNQYRVIHTNFPFFGKSKIKEVYNIADISSVECSQKNQYTMLLDLVVKGEKRQYSSTISPMVDSKTLANKFAEIVLAQNASARPDYLDDDEDIVEQFASKKNRYTITNKRFLQFNNDNELELKTNLSEFCLFDYYPGKMESLYLIFNSKGGNTQQINLSNYSSMSIESANGLKLVDNLYQLFAKNNININPDYLHDEELITTLRAGTSKMGAINPSHVIKLTEKRLIDLKIQKDGQLTPYLSIDLTDINSTKIVRHRGETTGGGIYEIKITLHDKTKHKYALGEQQTSELNKLRIALGV